MQVLSVECFDRDTLLEALRRTPLRGFGRVQPYAAATLELVPAQESDGLAPAQR